MLKQVDFNRFKGVHVAMNSCYDDEGRINPSAVRQLTRFLIDKGVQGLYVGGGTGEGLLQTVEERKLVLESVVAENQGAVTIIAHVGAITTADSVQMAQHAERIGVDAISSIPPFYYPYSEVAVKNYWTAMMDSTSLPFIIYYIPSATGFIMSTKMLQEMLVHEKLLGIKMTTFSTYDLQQFKAIGGENFIVFNGPDQQYLAGRSMGANAGIGGTYGVMPELFLAIEHYYSQENNAEAQRWQFIVNEIITDIRGLGLFGSIKEVIKMRGIDCGQPRLPLPAITSEQYPEVVKVYEKIMKYVKESQNRRSH